MNTGIRNIPLPMDPDWARSTQRRIDIQAALAAELKPGTDAHRLANEVLLLLRDSLHVLIEAHQILAQSKVDKHFEA